MEICQPRTRRNKCRRRATQLLLAAAALASALLVVAPAGATCFGDDCDGDPITEPDPTVDVYLPHIGEVDADMIVTSQGNPTGVALTGWSSAAYVRVTINGLFVMNVPSRDASEYMPHSGMRFTVVLPVYPWPADREVCVHAIDAPWGPAGTRLGCRSKFTWWV